MSTSERRLTAPQVTTTRPRVLVTGGSGRIGTLVAASLHTRYDLILLDRRPPADPTLPFVHADVSQLDALAPYVHNIDTVLHLAADPRPTAPWASVFPHNIAGALNVIQTACNAGCRRVVFASSLHAVMGYPPHVFVDAQMPPCPPNLYGASKVWGEALAQVYAVASSTSILCVRIGLVARPDAPQVTPGHPHLDQVVTERDLVNMLAACIAAPASMHFGIFHAVSDRGSRRFDVRLAEELLGFIPQDTARTLAWRNLRGMLRRGRARLRRSRCAALLRH
jgi:NAD(P)-dependent dehydrogenase (short-subunit alcohol dehydrogenase family)